MTGKIVIVGVGALGSHVALLGRNWTEGLKLIDYDRVEMKNTQAQFHGRQGLSKNKAKGLAQALHSLFRASVEPVPHKLTDDNAEALLGGSRLVLDCTDNIEAREVIQRAVKAHGLPCLHGAVNAEGTFGRVVWTQDFVPDGGSPPGTPTCEDGEFLPFFALVSAQIAWAAQRFLRTGQKQSFQMSPGGMIRLV